MNNQQPSIYTGEPPQANKSSKALNKVIVAALIVIALSVGIFLKWEYQSNTVLSVKNAPFPTRVISQGGDGAIVLTIDACKTQRVDGSLRVSYVSKTREVFLPLTEERSDVGCRKLDAPILIPKDLPADTYQIKFRATYNVNPIKKNVIEEFLSQSFTIRNTGSSNPSVVAN